MRKVIARHLDSFALVEGEKSLISVKKWEPQLHLGRKLLLSKVVCRGGGQKLGDGPG